MATEAQAQEWRRIVLLPGNSMWPDSAGPQGAQIKWHPEKLLKCFWLIALAFLRNVSGRTNNQVDKEGDAEGRSQSRPTRGKKVVNPNACRRFTHASPGVRAGCELMLPWSSACWHCKSRFAHSRLHSLGGCSLLRTQSFSKAQAEERQRKSQKRAFKHLEMEAHAIQDRQEKGACVLQEQSNRTGNMWRSARSISPDQ